MLQLAGKENLERLLELVNDKLGGNPLFSNFVQVSAAEHSRLDKMESLIEKLAVKADPLSTTSTSKARVTCANCGKSNHLEHNFLKSKTRFKCKEKGHIARFRKAGNAEYKATPWKASATVQQVKPSKRLFLKVNISGKELMFFHDTGSQFSIITRDDYDKLPTKPPLQQMEQSGVGIDGSKFAFDGIIYLNLVLSNGEGETFELSYEPVQVSSQVSSNVSSNSEEKFILVCRNSEESIMMFTTKSRKSLKVKCYRENIEATTAYIRIAKFTVVGTKTRTFVKARAESFQDVDQCHPYI